MKANITSCNLPPVSPSFPCFGPATFCRVFHHSLGLCSLFQGEKKARTGKIEQMNPDKDSGRRKREQEADERPFVAVLFAISYSSCWSSRVVVCLFVLTAQICPTDRQTAAGKDTGR
jgi:hypothetical protein